MRVIDILLEASIFTKPQFYKFGHKVRPSDSKYGKFLKSAIERLVPGYNSGEDLTWIDKPKKNDPNWTKIIIPMGRDMSNIRYFQRPNEEIFGISGADNTIQSALNHAPGQKGSTAENKGDASEPVLSAAVVAKLIKRGADNIEPITEDDVKHVLAQALANPNLEFVVNDMNSKLADKISFSIRVKDPILSFIKSPGFWDSYGPVLPSVVHYANSGQLDHYANHFYKNGKVDEINVKSDGVTEATERKTDVEAKVNGRSLKNLNISLKAGSPHIGQVGAGNLKDPFSDQITDPVTGKTKGQIGIWTASMRLFSPFGVEIKKPKGAVTSKVLYWTDAYKQAAKQIKSMLANADAKTEAGIVVRIANLVKQHGTSGDENIKLISLGTKGVSTIHSFKNLEKKLTANHIDLDCEYREGKSKTKGDPRPEIRIFDKSSGAPVVYIRYSSTEDEKKIWNTIEMKELLKQLTTLSYEKQIPRADTVAPEPAPAVNTAPVQSAPKSNFIAPDTSMGGKKLRLKPVTHSSMPPKPDWKKPEQLASLDNSNDHVEFSSE
jgi:hypothetical protein